MRAWSQEPKSIHAATANLTISRGARRTRLCARSYLSWRPATCLECILASLRDRTLISRPQPRCNYSHSFRKHAPLVRLLAVFRARFSISILRRARASKRACSRRLSLKMSKKRSQQTQVKSCGTGRVAHVLKWLFFRPGDDFSPDVSNEIMPCCDSTKVAFLRGNSFGFFCAPSFTFFVAAPKPSFSLLVCKH